MFNSISLRAVYCFATFLLLVASNVQAQDVRTLNFDFGNAGAYVGDAGILSSPGGTHWNQVMITSYPPGSGIAIQFAVPALLDEFGQTFNIDLPHGFPLSPDLTSGFQEGYETTAVAAGPLNDGVNLTGTGGFGFLIRELSQAAPVDVVIYFNNPDNGVDSESTVALHSNSLGDSLSATATNPTGAFPGIEGRDYARFNNVPILHTTIGYPLLPGVSVDVPWGETANIAAIQIRGEFVFTPEPTSFVLALLGGSWVLLRRG